MKGILKGTGTAAWLAAIFTAVLWTSVICIGLALRTVWQKCQNRTVAFLCPLDVYMPPCPEASVHFCLFCAEGYPSQHLVF